MPIHTTMAPYGITPAATEDTQPIWDGAKQGKLVVQHCKACGTLQWPPTIWCSTCKDPDTEKDFVPVSGKASLYTWYMCHDTSIAGFEDKVPYAVIYVELAEQPGLLLMGNMLNFEYGELGEGFELGMPLEVVFDKATDDLFMPQWQPARS